MPDPETKLSCSTWQIVTGILGLVAAVLLGLLIYYATKKPAAATCPNGQSCLAPCPACPSTGVACPNGQSCLPPCPAASALGNKFLTLPNTDMPGGDLGDRVNTAGGASCEDRCLADPTCVGAVKEATGSLCWLKKSISALTPVSSSANRTSMVRVVG